MTFTPYKLVLMPAFNLMTEEIADKCEAYVAGGGSLLITFRSGTRTWNNRMTTLTLPGLFRRLAGVELEEYDSVNFGRTVSVSGEFGDGTASMWCDVLKLEGAESLADYESHYYSGTPAVTVHTYGKGKVYYVGCDLDDRAMESLMKLVLEREGAVPSLSQNYDGVEAVEREKDGKSYLMLLNHRSESVDVELGGTYINALSKQTIEGRILLEPYAVHVLLNQGI